MRVSLHFSPKLSRKVVKGATYNRSLEVYAVWKRYKLVQIVSVWRFPVHFF